ncbi:uncharacterized protein [Haliotis asinina]|uniref:uncharacterized protein n=1 Tax=Haliotis asinina TaxID=109174 RepID=UPI0035321ECE
MDNLATIIKAFSLLVIVAGTLAFPAKEDDGRKLEHVIRQVIANRNNLGGAVRASSGDRSALLAQILDIARANSQKRNNTPVAYAGIGGGNAGRRLFRGRRGMNDIDLKDRLQILADELQAIARDLDDVIRLGQQ